MTYDKGDAAHLHWGNGHNGAPDPSGRQKALAWLIGGLCSGIVIGAGIGFTVWSPAEGLALGLALGCGMGGVPAALYCFGDSR